MGSYLTFSQALELLKQGKIMSRMGFNQPHKIAIQNPDENSANNQPYLYITTPQGARVPWVASQCDLLKDDWYEVVA